MRLISCPRSLGPLQIRVECVSKGLKQHLVLAGIVVLLAGSAFLSWTVTGSVPPNCHKKLNPGFCGTRKERFFRDGPGAFVRPIALPTLVSTTPR